MRFRFLLVAAAAAAVAVIAVPAAGALTFPDDVCPVRAGTIIKVCPSGETGKSYSYQLKGRDGTGCVPFVTFKAAGLPPGLSIDANSGMISGVPTQTGTYVFWVTMTDIPASQGGVFWCGDSDSTEKQFEITINTGLQIQQRQSVLTPAQLTVPYNMPFTASSGTPTWSVSAGSLPAGLTLDPATGVLSGTATATGDYTFKVTATAGSSTDTQTYAMSVVPKLVVGQISNVAEVGIAYRFVPHATGGKPGYTWTLDGALPAGLTMDAATGTISGKPAAAGRSTLKLTVKDTAGLSLTLDYPLTVVQRLLLGRETLRTAKAGSPYSALFLKTGGARPFKWTMTGGPRGLKIGPTGRLSGTPTKAGTYPLRVQVGDALGALSSKVYVLKVKR